ncbi:MAG: hypothetical protein GXP05_14605 [Alphaproteobacteria bacterium]|nr:hypothetical protein [Alphaproteobacteria bacterium]
MGEFYTVEQLVNEGPRYAMAFLLKSLSHGEPFVTYKRINRYIEQKLEIEKGRIVRHQGHAVGEMMNRILEADKNAPLINALTTGPDGIPGDGVAGYINKKYRNGKTKKWGDLSNEAPA